MIPNDIVDLDKLKAGSQPEFNKFYIYFQPKVKGLINYYGHNLTPDEIEDITQDTFTKAHRGIAKCKANTANSLFSWLGTILRNATYDYVKKKNKHEIIEHKIVDSMMNMKFEEGDVAVKVLEQEVMEDLSKLLSQTFNGSLLYEKTVLGKSSKELAIKYDCTPTAVSQRILREKKRLTSKKEIFAILT